MSVRVSAGPRRRHRTGGVWRACAHLAARAALAIGLAAAPGGAAAQGLFGSEDGACRFEPPFWTPLHLLSRAPAGVRSVTVEGWFELIPARESSEPDRFFLRDDRGLGGRIALVPVTDIDDDFRFSARSLMGRRLEVTGCLGEGSRLGEHGSLHFRAWAVIPEPKRERPPRDVDLASLRDGAFQGQRVRLVGALAGRRHHALPLSTRSSDSDWILAAEDAAAWMRGHGPEGEGFRLDPDDADDRGRGLAVLGLLSWWRDVPVLHVESVLLAGGNARATVAILFALPLDRRLDAAEPAIEVRFSAAMDETSFEGRVELASPTGATVPARWDYDAEVWSLVVSPQAPLPPGSELLLRLLEGLVSAEGGAVRPEAGSDPGILLSQTYRIP